MKNPLPKRIAQHRRLRPAVAVFVRRKLSPCQRRESQHAEKSRRDPLLLRVLHPPGGRQVHSRRTAVRRAVHISGVIPHRFPDPPRLARGVAFIAVGIIMARHRRQPLRLRIRQRPQQHRVHHAENRRVRPDAQRQRRHCRRAERGALAQCPRRIPEVPRDFVRPAEPCRFPAFLGHRRLAAEFHPCPPPRFLCIHAPRHQVPRVALDVIFHFGRDVPLHLLSALPRDHVTPPARPQSPLPAGPTPPVPSSIVSGRPASDRNTWPYACCRFRPTPRKSSRDALAGRAPDTKIPCGICSASFEICWIRSRIP